MTFPTSATSLTPLIQASDGAQAAESVVIPGSAPYTYRLGANASPALATGVQRVPKGAFPLVAPLVISADSAVTSKGHFLTPSSTYKYALTNVTAKGETTADNVYTVTTGATATDSTGRLLTLPAVTASTDNPVISRRLYRSKAGLTSLLHCADLSDLSLTTWTDGLSDDDLGQAPPVSNGSGLTGAVVVTGGGYGSWTEVAPGATLAGGEFKVDYTYSLTGGTVTFAAVDAGKTISVVYTATTYVSKALFNTMITAITEMAATGTVIVAQGVTHNLAAGERWLACNGGVMGGTTTINLASVTPYTGQEVMISNRSGVGTTLIVPNTSTDTINGAASYSLTTPYSSVTLKYSSSLWIVVQRGV